MKLLNNLFRHPNIIAYKEAFLEENNLCIVMEFATGGDMFKKITEHKTNGTHFSEKHLWHYFIQVNKFVLSEII
jgi:NIMA (never in mitosis gene a)-related kinase 1/4/5